MVKNRYAHALVAAGIGFGLVAAPAMAQDDDTIIVTATKRAQSILDVPVAVSAYGEDTLRKTGVDDIQEIMGISPSFQASTNVSESQGLVIRLRGIGTQGNNPAFESAVGVFVDGVYRSRAGAALSELLDIERIEVLRGPQGTLFGRNTTAGALNIVTLGPEREFGGYLEASYGNFNYVDVRGSVTGPIGGKMAGRLSALYHRRDGLVEDFITGEEYDDRNRYTLKAQLEFEPSEKFNIRIIGDYRDQDETCCYPVTLFSGVAADVINAIGFPTFGENVQLDPADPFSRTASKTVGEPAIQEVQDWGVSGEITWDFGSFNLVSISAYRKFDSFRQLDIDFTAVDLVNQDRRDDGIKAFTEEVRFQGEWKWLDWMFGGYYIDETITLSGQITHGADYEAFINGRLGPLLSALSGGGIPDYSTLAFIGDPVNCGGANFGTCWADGTGTGVDFFQSDNTAYSFFTHNVISLTDHLKLTLGTRFNVDEKDAFSDLSATNTPGCEAIKNTPLVNTSALTASFDFLGIIPGDTRRVVDVILALGCLGIASPAFEYDVNKDDDEWTGIGSLSYQWDDGTLLYGSFSRGFKAGGANLDRAGTILTATGVVADLPATPFVNEGVDNFLDPRFKAEIVDSYEAGVKGPWWGGKGQYSLTVFKMDIDDFQLNTFTGFNFVPENVDAATTVGVELEFTTRPVEGLDIRGGLTWAQTDYDDGITDLTNILTNERGFRLPGGIDDLPIISSLAGRQLTNAPRWVETLSVTYTRPLPNTQLEAFGHFDFRIDSGYNTGSDLDPIKEQDGYTVVNAQLGVAHVDQNWEVVFWVKNLFDKGYQQIAFDIPLQSNDGWGTFLADPRFYGGTVRMRF